MAEAQTVAETLGDSESLEDVKVELERREQALRATEEERDTLMCELEELDRQSQEATQVCLALFVIVLLASYHLDYSRAGL